MQCPACKTDLRMADRSGVEIDFCPACRGVWLDRGELDKIIERASRFAARPAVDTGRDGYDGDGDDDSPSHRSDPRQRRRRGGFLAEMFDFD